MRGIVKCPDCGNEHGAVAKHICISSAPATKDVTSILRSAGFNFQIGNLKIGVCEAPNKIWIDRDGDGGEFDAEEFRQTVERFFDERF